MPQKCRFREVPGVRNFESRKTAENGGFQGENGSPGLHGRRRPWAWRPWAKVAGACDLGGVIPRLGPFLVRFAIFSILYSSDVFIDTLAHFLT